VCSSAICLLVRVRRMLTAITQTAQPKTQAQVEMTIATVSLFLVFRCLLRAINDQNLNRSFFRLQPEAKLLLQGGED
jgi:hypothetical protein